MASRQHSTKQHAKALPMGALQQPTDKAACMQRNKVMPLRSTPSGHSIKPHYGRVVSYDVFQANIDAHRPAGDNGWDHFVILTTFVGPRPTAAKWALNCNDSS